MRPLPDAQTQELRGIGLVVMLTGAQSYAAGRGYDGNWGGTFCGGMAALDREMARLIQASPLWRARDELLRSVPGIGNVTASLVAALPELGRLNRKQMRRWWG